MFFCCGRSTPKEAPDAPTDIDPPVLDKSLDDSPLSSETYSNINIHSNTNIHNEKPAALAPSPAPQREEMDYARSRRSAEDRERRDAEMREQERKRSEISAMDGPSPLTLSISATTLKPEGGYLSQNSPRIEEKVEVVEDDWAKDLIESVSRAGSTHEGDKSRPVSPTPRVEVSQPQVVVVVQPKEEEERSSQYISAVSAASFMDFDASLLPHAPPTPAQSVNGTPASSNVAQMGSARCPSPAPSVSISLHEAAKDQEAIYASRRNSAISIISTIAAAAATCALKRHASAASHRRNKSNLSAHSFASTLYSTRPNSPNPPTNNRLSTLRGMRMSMESSRPSLDLSRPSMDSSVESSVRDSFETTSTIEAKGEDLLEPMLMPLTANLLPSLDRLLSTTSILSNYSRWESAMGLRREVRAFVASGVDDFLDEETGFVLKVAPLKRSVESFVARGRVIDRKSVV